MNRWGVCVLLFLATLLNYLDRQTLSYLVPHIRSEMGFDLERQGILFSVFYWSYAAAQIGAGFLVDRFPVKVAYAVAVALWSLAGAAGGLATGLWSLLFLRGLLGLCESANWPCAMRVVSRTFVPRERPLANGIFQSGTSVGALVAPLLLFHIYEWKGWRAGFIGVGLVGLVWVVAWLAAYRPGPPLHEAAPAEAPSPVRLREILRSRPFWGLVIASSFINPVMYFYVNWLPTYFKESGQEYGLKVAWLLTAIYLALDAGYLTGGALSAWLSRRCGPRRARTGVMAAGTALMIGVLVLPLSRALGFRLDVYAVAGTIAAGALGVGWFLSNYLSFAEEVSHERVSTVSGLLGAAGSVSGAIFMWLVGALAERTGGFTIPFLLLGSMPLVAFAGILLGAARRRPARAGPEQASASRGSAAV
jgi:ACS family hexuronate transporter-like MFS transporter